MQRFWNIDFWNKKLKVKLATLTNIAIKRTLIHKYPAPYSDCIDMNTSFSSILYKIILEKFPNRTYRQADCFDFCLQKNIIETCDCYYLEFPSMFNVEPCLNTTQLICAASEYRHFLNIEVKKVFICFF